MVAPAVCREAKPIQFLHLHRKPVQAVGQAGKVLGLQLGLCRYELLLLQAVLGKFIRGIYLPGAQIDAGSLYGGAVVIDDNPAGTAIHSRCDGRGISTSDLRHATTGCAHRGTVLGQPEEEEIGSKDATDIGIEKLRPSRAAGGGRSEKLLRERRGRFHGAPREPERVLPRSGIGGTRPAKTDCSTRGIVEVKIADSGLMEVECGAAGGALADSGPRQQRHRGGVGFDKNGGSAVIGADDEGCAVGDIDNRSAHDTGTCASACYHERCEGTCRGVDLIEASVRASDH
jgi:hypothetical protein